MTETISVIIPTYNRSADVVRAAKSALAQIRKPQQIIVVDDGSTDGTREAVMALPAPVLYLKKQNGGVSSARNLGFKHATGDYVFLCDSDDYWDPHWTEAAIDAISKTPDAGAAACTQFCMVAADGQNLGVNVDHALGSNGVIKLPELFLGGITGSTLCLRANVLTMVGEYDSSLRTAEDIDFALRIAAVTTIVAVSRPLVFVTQSVESLSKFINTGNRLIVYRKFESLFPSLAAKYGQELHKARIETTLSYARDLISARQFPDARARLRESWAYRPTWEALILSLKVTLLTLLCRDKPKRK